MCNRSCNSKGVNLSAYLLCLLRGRLADLDGASLSLLDLRDVSRLVNLVPPRTLSTSIY